MFLAIAGFASQAMVRVTDSLLPQIAASFDTSVGTAAIVVTGYGIGHGASQIFLGAGGDWLGKYRAAAISCGIAAVLVFACALMPTLTSLAALRFLSGCAAGWIIPLGMAYVGDVTPYEQRQPVLGRYLTGNIGGLLFGQIAGGVLGDFVGWRMMFVVLAALLALATIGLVYELMTNPRTHTATHPDETSRGLVADYITVFSSSWARIVIFAVAVEGAAFWGTFTYIGADLHLRFNLSYTLIGLIVATFACGGLVYIASIKLLIFRFGQRGLTVIGACLVGVAFFVLAAGLAWWLAPFAIGAIGLGFYMLHNTLQVNATQMTPQARGTAIAAFSAALYLAMSGGAAIGAYLFDHLGAPPLFIGAGVIIPALGIWFSYQLRKRERETAV